MYELGAFFDELSHDADGDFLHALGFDFDANGAGDALELFGGGDVFFAKMVEDGAGFAGAADHAEEQKRFVNPILEDERIVTMAAGDDEGEGGIIRQWERREFFPDIDLEGNFGREIVMVGEGGTVVEDGDLEIELNGERGDGLGDVACAGDPEIARGRDGFLVEPFGRTGRRKVRDGEFRFYAPRDG